MVLLTAIPGDDPAESRCCAKTFVTVVAVPPARSGLLLRAGGIRECQTVPERIVHRHVLTAPGRFFNLGSGISILLRYKFPLKHFQVIRLNPHRHAGTSVTVMLGQMKNAAIFRDLHVERQVIFKAMLPIQFEAEKIEIEFFRLRFIEDAQDRNGGSESHGGGFFDTFTHQGKGQMSDCPAYVRIHEILWAMSIEKICTLTGWSTDDRARAAVAQTQMGTSG